MIRHTNFSCLLTSIAYNSSRCCGGRKELETRYTTSSPDLNYTRNYPAQAQEIMISSNQEFPCEEVFYDHI